MVEKVSQIDMKRLNNFANNLFDGIKYYVSLTNNIYKESEEYKKQMILDFSEAKESLQKLIDKNNHVFNAIMSPLTVV